MSQIIALGETINDLASTLGHQLQDAKHPEPSFAADSPANFPPDPKVQEPRQRLIEALTDLLYLATGANDYLFLHSAFFLNYDATVIDILYQFDIFSKVPLSGSSSYSEIAQATRLPETLVRKILRYAFTMRLFAPDKKDDDRIVHTAFSAHAARTPLLTSWVRHHLEDCRPAMIQAPEALRRFHLGHEKPTEELDETSFGLSWPPQKDGKLASFWQVLQEDPKQEWRANRFSEAMQASVANAMVKAEDVVDGFDWATLGSATVVDVGGSDGSLVIPLAEKHPQLQFVVQDLPSNQAVFKERLPSALSDRIRFQVQDFFKPQQQKADVFLMKHVLHNWSEKYTIQILQNLVKALNPGGRILVCDGVIPSEEALPYNARKGIAAADIHMFVMLNATERTVADYEQTARKADKRLRLASVHAVPGAIVSLLEFVLDS